MPSIVDYLRESRDLVQASIDDSGLLHSVEATTAAITKSFRQGCKLLTAGNGGSAGDAQHIAGEFISRLNYDRPPTASFALTTDTSVLTAVANDYGYDRVFERQILGLGRDGDVFIALSTSGRSPSILRAMQAARDKAMIVIAFTGRSGGGMPPLADIAIRVPSDSTPLIQQIHITLAHIICGQVEENLFPRATA